MLEGLEQGVKLLVSQRFEIVHAVVRNEDVGVETVWRGTLSVPFEKVIAGDEMMAYIAAFFPLVDGKIASQHTYDCFVRFQNKGRWNQQGRNMDEAPSYRFRDIIVCRYTTERLSAADFPVRLSCTIS